MIVLRNLAPEDLPTLAAISASQPTAPSWHEREFAALFAPQAPVRILLGAVSEDKLVAFAVALPVVDQAELEGIVVARAYQRQGIARQLLAEVIHRLEQCGVQQLHLELRRSNTAACALYFAAGFTVSGSRPGYYSAPDEDALQMTLEIHPISMIL
jgi:ribosomal-protein-alanine N-acetyltransferase